VTAAPRLSDDDLATLLGLLEGADSVELKLTVPESVRRSAVSALGMDPLDAQLRQVFFFDTPDLDLDRHGMVVRARRIQGRGDDSVVKLRPVVPDTLPAELRRLPEFVVEVDAMPGGFVCSASLKGVPSRRTTVRDTVLGGGPARRLFSKAQRAFFADHAPDGMSLDDLAVLGPINVMKLKFQPEGFAHKTVVELWLYPDGSHLLELSTKCPPDRAFDVAAEARAFLVSRGIETGEGAQQTKTRTALEFFSREIASA
jgi:hypothetical protein